MNKKEFLDILYEQLSGQMPEGNVAAHVQYYRNYIEDAVTQGRTETEVLNELGDRNWGGGLSPETDHKECFD